jgi:hypothetical protein
LMGKGFLGEIIYGTIYLDPVLHSRSLPVLLPVIEG